MRSRAIYGGTFDPIHNGHLHVALAVKEAFNLEQITFIPTGEQALKHGTETDKFSRLEMVKIATAPYGFETSDIEVKREGKSYTVDTLEELAWERPYFILGEDNISNILKWKDTKRLFSLCKFILVNRPKSDIDHDIIRIIELQGAIVHILTIPGFDLSATNIRYRVNTGKPINHIVPQAVADYIEKNGLYNAKIEFDFELAKSTLRQNMSAERYEHVLGVCGEAVKLAAHYKQCTHRAEIAAILHDWTKEYTDEQNEAAFVRCNYRPDKFVELNMKLCHGFLGAEIARVDFGIDCEDTLNAIRYHTIGRPQMSMLEKVVCIADAIEPTRGDDEHLAALRRLAYEDINRAMAFYMNYTFRETMKKGKNYHPIALDAFEEYGKYEE